LLVEQCRGWFVDLDMPTPANRQPGAMPSRCPHCSRAACNCASRFANAYALASRLTSCAGAIAVIASTIAIALNTLFTGKILASFDLDMVVVNTCFTVQIKPATAMCELLKVLGFNAILRGPN
jgi:hypothetical protein